MSESSAIIEEGLFALSLSLFTLAVNVGEGGQGTMHMKGNRDTELSERVSRVSE